MSILILAQHTKQLPDTALATDHGLQNTLFHGDLWAEGSLTKTFQFAGFPAASPRGAAETEPFCETRELPRA